MKRGIRFDSSDGRSSVAGFFWQPADVKPWCVVQLSHGMCEYLARYDDFAAFLAQNGVAVCGNDHIGHGDTAPHEGELGFFGQKGGRRFAVQDLKTMNDEAHRAFPGLPVVLLGHSMGSFFARKYAVQYPESIDGLILSGTGGPNPLAGMGIFLTRVVTAFRGNRHRARFLHNLAFGAYLKRIENPRTPHDWISRDTEIVDKYAADPLCTFHFTANGFGELFAALKDVTGPGWAAGVRRDMPLLLFSGDADPVGDYGRGVDKVHGWLRDAGVEKLEYILYPGGRHEMLNETNRAEVYADVLGFLKKHFLTTEMPE